MKIITWNCCLPPWSLTRKRRIPEIVNEMKRQDADVICLQEVFFRSDGRYIVAKLRSAGFQDFFQFKNLLIASKYHLSRKQSFVFEAQGDLFSWAILDVIYEKGFQLVEFSHNGELLWLVNAHLLSANAVQVHAARYQSVREKQIEQILSVMDTAQTGVVVGDMNFEPGTLPYQKIITYGFSDAIDKKITTCKGTRPDHLFLKGLAGECGKIFLKNENLSDHAALMVQTTDSPFENGPVS